jgi:hypothetical protein
VVLSRVDMQAMAGAADVYAGTDRHAGAAPIIGDLLGLRDDGEMEPSFPDSRGHMPA